MQSKEQNVELTNICVVHSGNDVGALEGLEA